MSDSNQITIDGVPIPFDAEESILSAAHRAGVYIPHLCFHPELSAHGSCKLCTVRINGRSDSACQVKAAEGMEVVNNSDELRQLRKQLVELLFAEGNHFCPSCELSGNCQLQAMAYELGVDHVRYPLQYPSRDKDGSHAEIFLDRDRCILCGLCCRASIELDGKRVFTLGGRGAQSQLQINSADGTLATSDLLATDRAANICPVGAIFPKQHNYQQRPGERLYDQQPISVIGNRHPSQVVQESSDE